MVHQDATLLLNMKVRHIIDKVKTSKSELKAQLTRLKYIAISNYFILGK